MTKPLDKTQKFLTQSISTFVGQEEFKRLCQLVHDRETPVTCGQAVGSSPGLVAAELAMQRKKPVVIITPDQSSAYLALDDVEFFLNGRKNAPPVFVFPHLEILPYESHVPELTIRMERLAPIQHYIENRPSGNRQGIPMVVVAPISAVLKRMPALSLYEEKALRCIRGKEISRDQISAWLVAQGYEFRDLVAQRGDFSVRGDIIDIYSYSYPEPVRIEYWGDEVDSIRLFNISDQRSIGTIDEAVFYPGNEDVLIRESLNIGSSLFAFPHLFGEETLVLISNVDEVEKEGQSFRMIVDKCYFEASRPSDDHEVHLSESDFHKLQDIVLEPPETLYLSTAELDEEIESLRTVHLTEFSLETAPDCINLGCVTPEIFGEDRKERIASLIRLSTSGQPVLIVCDNSGQQNRLDEILEIQCNELKLVESDSLPLTIVGNLHRGFAMHTPSVLLCTDREIFGRYKRFRTPIREGIALPVTDLVDLQVGDYVVHIDHGIGRFVRMKRMEHEGRESEYMELEYAEGGVLYVPIEQIDRVGRYIGGENVKPALAKLGTKNWDRTKARAREAIEDMAEELLDLYATRSIRKGHAFCKDTTWQNEFEASFLYEETPDQWRAIEEVKRDMESEEPMDRLICGDVGFGKTEVAIRAAFKAVMDGKQVAILVPTTILCQQHYNNFRERLTDYPVRVEMMSRFHTPGELKEIAERISNSEVDIVIGTHRLLSADIQFQDLGLVIIDEEQRFGVKHKERLRQMRKLVDTLTLTATPIPRTMYMSLSGIRNMSLVSTPPKNRLPIETYIMEWSKEVISNAVLRELSRDGQVYIVHNRVETIYRIAGMIQEIVPQARICVGHGQMSEHELEGVMMDFIRHEYDVLVATTIIENGIDIPNVNTIIINNADHFGLSQLYQLRGRVGRDRHRAYCYLLVPSKNAISSISRRRLLALQEHNQLGAGFHLAMRDMELRGVGNILGRQQHGHIAAIGFDLYSKLLRETVTNLKSNKQLILDWDTMLEVSPKGTIPPNYVESSKQRMALHQRIAKIKTAAEIESLAEELKDIYGKIPSQVEKLIFNLQIRVHAHQAGFDTVQIRRHQGFLRYHVSQSERFNPLRILQLDGKDGLKLVVAAKDENVGIEFHDTAKSGNLPERIMALIDALEQEPEEASEELYPAASKPVPSEKKKKKINKKIRKYL